MINLNGNMNIGGNIKFRGTDFWSTTLLNGLIDYWKFDEASGSQVYSETSSEVGTFTSGSWAAGKKEYGLGFTTDFPSVDTINFTTDYDIINADNYPTIIGQKITFNFWVKMDWLYVENSYSDIEITLSKLGEQLPHPDGFRPEGYKFKITNTLGVGIEVGNEDDTYRIFTSTNNNSGLNALDKNWHMITICVDAPLNSGVMLYTDIHSYTNGVYSAANPPFNQFDDRVEPEDIWNSGDFMITVSNVGNSIATYIDEFAVWNRVLTQAEVTELYNNKKGLTHPFIPH